MHTQLHRAKGALSQCLPKQIPIINILQLLKLLKIRHMQRLLPRMLRPRCPILLSFSGGVIGIVGVAAAVAILLLVIRGDGVITLSVARHTVLPL